MLDDVESVECRPEVDTIQDHLRNEGIIYASTLEDRRAVVEEVVGASQSIVNVSASSTGELGDGTYCWNIWRPIPSAIR